MNWYLVEEDGKLTAVDAGLPAYRKALASDLSLLGHALGDVEAVVLTHSDGDHIGLVHAFRGAGARVLINTGDEVSLRKPGPKSGDAKPMNVVPQLWHPSFWKLIAHLATSGGLVPKGLDGAETFSADAVLDVPGSPRVVPTPGHTNGHSALHFESKDVVFVGDALCTRNPITGRVGAQVMPSALNISTDQCFESLGAIENVSATVVLPGHGDPWREGTRAAVESAKRLGRT